jgi:hypothetical protein
MSGSQRVTYGTSSISSRYPSWRQRASRRSFLYPFAVRGALVRLAACYPTEDVLYLLDIMAPMSESSDCFFYPSIVTDVHLRIAACHLPFLICSRCPASFKRASRRIVLYLTIVTDVHVRLAACYLQTIFYVFEISSWRPRASRRSFCTRSPFVTLLSGSQRVTLRRCSISPT